MSSLLLMRGSGPLTEGALYIEGTGVEREGGSRVDVATLKSGGTRDLTQEENRAEYRGSDYSEHRNREGKVLAPEQLELSSDKDPEPVVHKSSKRRCTVEPNPFPS